MAEEPEARALVEALVRAAGGQEQGQQGGVTPGNIISGVDVTKLIEYVFEERGYKAEETIEELREIRDLLVRASAISRELVDVYVKDGLSRIVHPVYGIDAIVTRFHIVAELLRSAVRAKWRNVIDAMRAGRSPQDVYKAAKEAERFTKLALISLVEVYDKLLTLLYINAPAEARPPLANISLGYDMLKIEEEKAERLRRRRQA